MLAKCANPECSQVFRYLGEGKVYRTGSTGFGQGARTDLEHFWLCPKCVGEMMVAIEPNGRVIVIPRTMLAPYRDT